MANQVRVRIAPSPTGPLHIGTARTALFNWLFARKNNGTFILRIEDTDLERSNPKFEEDIKDSLNWLELTWEEFYKQSERIDVYKNYLQKLLDEEKAFWCYHTVEELKKESEEQMARREAPRHICEHKYAKSKIQMTNDKKGIIRLKVDENSTRVIHFDDIVRGKIEWKENLIGDLSLAKNLETPLYNFAVVIDDHETKISHVIRGEDHISNTPKQILVQEALGIKQPQYAHLPLILGPDRTKLSKRHGAESVREYQEQGYLSETMVNFMALLGWRPGKVEIKGEKPEDIYSVEELSALFDLKDAQKSPAVFDIKKLNWINGYYIHQLPPEQFRAVIEPFIIKELNVNRIKDEYLDKIQHLMTERMEKLSDVKNFDYFFKDPEYDKELLNWKNSSAEDIKKSLALIKESFEPVDWEIFDKDYIKKKLDDLAKKNFGGDRGVVYWPLRVALTGREGSPDPIDILSILDKETVIKRLNNAIAK